MKQLKKLLLIHWHFFNFEIIEFDKVNFLTGKNAAGKSTLIDALQLILLGDANGRHFFNKAANEKSSRSLKGYLRGELGDDGDVGFKYIRDGRFTSYIACEFFDDLKNTSFTIGVVFDCCLPDNCFIVNNTPLSYRDLRAYVNKSYKKGKCDFPDTDKSFKEVLKGRFGGLKNKYFDLLKKAVSFTPITDIETFITEYVCDVRNPVDISLMQDNIRYYKRLEYDADLMGTRVATLKTISEKYGSYCEEKQRLEMQNYIIDRARLQGALDEINLLKSEVARLENEIRLSSEKQAKYNSEIASLSEKKDRLVEDKLKSDIHTKLEKLRNRKDELNIKIKELSGSIQTAVQRLRRYALMWRNSAESCAELANSTGEFERELLGDETAEIERTGVLVDKHSRRLLSVDAEGISALATEGFQSIIDDTTRLRELAAGMVFSVNKKRRELGSFIETQTKTLQELQRGIKPYDSKLISLKNEIQGELEKEYGKPISVFVLADLLEIKDVRWKNAIEGYLHTQKFYLIVEPEYFIDALKVYDRLKFQMGFYDFGLVDTGKLERASPKCDKGSLAEEVITGNIYARLFIDFCMGKVMKCDKVEFLRSYDKSITDSCMLYQGYVARQLNPERWKYPFIGKNSLEEQIKNTKISIGKAAKEAETCEKYSRVLSNVKSMDVINQNEAQHYQDTAEGIAALPLLEDQLKKVVEEMGEIDLAWLLSLEGKIRETEEKIKVLEDNEKECAKSVILAQNGLNIIVNEKMPQAGESENNHRHIIAANYEKSWADEKGEPRFAKELSSRRSAKELAENFSSQLERTRSQTEKKKDDLESLRSDYNRDYKMSYDIKQVGNLAYDKEYDELSGIRLPSYKKQIQDAKDKAFQQFQDDFLAKLKSNIDTVKSQIEELNSALKESTWGNERYRFTWLPHPEFRRYYDMITDEMLLEGYNIASQNFRDKHRDAIDELFRQITDIDSELNSDARAELEKSIKRFTDYRTYMSFDLAVTDNEGRTQRLSKTLQKKSGGETQTPFYISVLASFAQLYRMRDASANRIRLIIFDEAFSKMDGERIQESIRLLRKFGFQCILSAPSEKVGDIAPFVDKNLCVIRDRVASIVKAFDSKKLLEEEPDEL